MKLTIVEAAPGQWRWIFVNAAGRALASSALFPSAAERWLVLAKIAAPPARIH